MEEKEKKEKDEKWKCVHLSWRKAGNAKFISVREFSKRDERTECERFDTVSHLCAFAPGGGIIVTYKTSVGSKFSKRLNIFDSSLRFINTISLSISQGEMTRGLYEWYQCAPVCFIGVTKEEVIVVLMDNGTVLFLNQMGVLICFLTMEDDKEEKREIEIQPKIAKLVGNSLAVLTCYQEFLFIPDIRRPKWIKVTRDNVNDLKFVSPAVLSALSFDFLMPEGSDIPLVVTFGIDSKLIWSHGMVESVVNIPGNIIRCSFSPSGNILSVIAEQEGQLFVYFKGAPKSGISTKVKLNSDSVEGLNASAAKAIISPNIDQIVFCGDKAVVLLYSKWALFVDIEGSVVYIDDISTATLAVSEVDACRLLYGNSENNYIYHRRIEPVHNSIVKMFMEQSLARKLMSGYNDWVEGKVTQFDVTSHDKMEVMEAIEVARDAAKYVDDPEAQQLFLHTAWYGKSSLPTEEMHETERDNVAIVLRIVNRVQEGLPFAISQDRTIPINMQITYAEMCWIGYEAFVLRLCNRGQHSYAHSVSEMLLTDKSVVANHYAYTRLMISLQNSKAGEKISTDCLPKVGTGTQYLDYALMADAAFHAGGKGYGRFDICADLLKREQIPSRIKAVYSMLEKWKKTSGDHCRSNDAMRSIEQLASDIGYADLMSRYAAEGALLVSDETSDYDVLRFRIGRMNVDESLAFLFDMFREGKQYNKEIHDAIIEKIGSVSDQFYRKCLDRFLEVQRLCGDEKTGRVKCMYDLINEELQQGNPDKAEQYAKLLGVRESRFIWLKVQFYLRTPEQRSKLTEMKAELKKINALSVFYKCLEKNWIDIAANLISCLSRSDRCVASEALERVLNA